MESNIDKPFAASLPRVADFLTGAISLEGLAVLPVVQDKKTPYPNSVKGSCDK